MTAAPLPDLLSLAIQVAMGVGLAACAGLRAFLPLLVVGLAGRLELVSLSESFSWLATGPALVVLTVAVVAELLADKVPVVDHALDVLGTLVKPVAGTLLAASVLTDLPPLPAAVLALCTGGAVSAGVHLSKAKLRLLSTATTGGIGNPFLSILEDVGAAVGSVVALVVPLLLASLFLAGLVGLLVLLAARRARAHSLP